MKPRFLKLIALLPLPLLSYADSYENLHEKSDLVAIISISEVLSLTNSIPGNPNPKYYRNYEAICVPKLILKGTFTNELIRIPFFQHPYGVPAKDGYNPPQLTQWKRTEFLVFLKKNEGIWTPTTGHANGASSIKHLSSTTPRKRLSLPFNEKIVTIRGELMNFKKNYGAVIELPWRPGMDVEQIVEEHGGFSAFAAKLVITTKRGEQTTIMLKHYLKYRSIPRIKINPGTDIHIQYME